MNNFNQVETLDFHYQMTKGRLAETIIEELFIASGFEVHRFGMENMVPGLVRKLRRNYSDVSWHIKKMPDFVMYKNDTVHFVEVKYKGDGNFDIHNLEKDQKFYPFEDCIIIVVTPDKIKALTVQELKAKKTITPACKNYLGNRAEFGLDEARIKEYLQIVKAFFEKIPARL
jgi:hypothetical protein